MFQIAKESKENIIEVGLKLLSDVKEGESFYTVNGLVLNNIRELAALLESIQKEHFDHHVNEDKNDFSEWIKYSVGDEKLAGRMKKAKTPQQMQKLISQRLSELEESLMDYEEHPAAIKEKKNSSKATKEKKQKKSAPSKTVKSAKPPKKAKEVKKSGKEEDKGVEEDDFNKEIEREYQKINDPESAADDSNYYSHDEILKEIEKAINDADSKFIIDSLSGQPEVQEEGASTSIIEPSSAAMGESKSGSEKRQFYFADFTIGFVLGLILGILATIAYYSFFI